MRVIKFVALLTIIVSAVAHADDSLDLPIEPPKFGESQHPEGVPLPPPPPPPPEHSSEDHLDTELPPPIFFGEEIPSESDTVFYVLDKSGSMMATMPYPIPPTLLPHFGRELSNGQFLSPSWSSRWNVARMECLKSIQGLSDNFQFNVIVYDCDALQWMSEPQQATPANKQRVTQWLANGDGSAIGGGTGTGPAVALALGWRENLLVILLTDGDPTCPESTDGQIPSRHELHQRIIRTANTQGARIDVFFVFTGMPLHESFCRGVANQNRGQFRSIHDGGVAH